MATTVIHSDERLTWEEIVKKYPDTWVGLKDIKFRNDDGANIETAVVAETGTRDELYDSMVEHRLNMVTPTNIDRFFFDNWAAWLL